MCRCVGGSFGHCVVFEAEAWGGDGLRGARHVDRYVCSLPGSWDALASATLGKLQLFCFVESDTAARYFHRRCTVVLTATGVRQGYLGSSRLEAPPRQYVNVLGASVTYLNVSISTVKLITYVQYIGMELRCGYHLVQ